jgi:hypothetical protein
MQPKKNTHWKRAMRMNSRTSIGSVAHMKAKVLKAWVLVVRCRGRISKFSANTIYMVTLKSHANPHMEARQSCYVRGNNFLVYTNAAEGE